jgi:hypothetical protein
MSGKRIGLVLSVSRLWMMSLPFRLGGRGGAPGFAPGARNLLVYESRRLGHWLYERERLSYHVGSVHSVLSRISRRG